MKKAEQAEMEKMEELRKIIEASPLTRKIKEDQAVVTLATRKAGAEKIEQLKQEAEAGIPEREAEMAAREAELARHDEEHKVILDKLATARLALTEERQRIGYETDQAEAVLLSNYDPRIDEAVIWFQARREALLVKSVDRDTSTGETNIFTLTKTVVTRSNAGAIASALAFCLNAIHKLEAMRLEPALDVERIEQLKKNVPATDEMQEYSGSKPLPRINTDARSLLKSDNQLGWELAKLNEKFQKWLIRR